MEDVIRVRTGERGRDALMYPDDIDVRSTEEGGAVAAVKAKPGGATTGAGPT